MKAKLDYQDLQISLTEFKIDSLRYDSYVRNEVLRRLKAVQLSMIGLVASKDLQQMNKREIDRLVKSVNSEIDKEYEKISAFLDKSNQDLYLATNQIESLLYNKWLGVGVFVALTSDKAKKITPIFEGRPMNDWWKRQQNDLKFNMETIVRSGSIEEKPIEETIEDIEHRIGVTASQSESLVRTMSAVVFALAVSTLITDNRKVIYGKRHSSIIDRGTTAECNFRNGLMWTLDNEPIGHSVAFKDTPLHYGCRSMIEIVVIDTVEQNIEIKENVNYEEWFKQQPESYQNEKIGKRRAKWVREGKITLNQALNQHDRPLTIEQLRKKYNL